jgi:hypothetical protein
MPVVYHSDQIEAFLEQRFKALRDYRMVVRQENLCGEHRNRIIALVEGPETPITNRPAG